MTADPEAVEAVSEILSRWAPGGTTVEPAFELVDEGLGARLDPSRPAIVRAYLPARDTRRRPTGRRRTSGSRWVISRRSACARSASSRRGSSTRRTGPTPGRRHFPVLRVGRRLVIRPTWRRHRRAPDDVVLALDPGMAFGTGLHPTTRLCLAGIERWADEGRLAPGAGSGRDGGVRVLDVGCGSGVLAIAAGLFGATGAGRAGHGSDRGRGHGRQRRPEPARVAADGPGRFAAER